MNYYIFIENGVINGSGQCQIMNANVINYEVTESQYNAFNENPDCYVLVDGVPTLDKNIIFSKAKEAKIAEVKSAFEQASVDAHCMTSLGFEVNADSVAKRNIDGLIERMEFKGIETEMFRGYDNGFHQVTLEQLKLMRIEVIDNGNALYQKKWMLEAQINACTTTEQVDAINIDFEV